MIPYILHVTVIITVCFLFYKLFLQKATFYRLNRWTLLACLTVSFALPFLPAPRGWSLGERYARAFAGLFQPHSDEQPNPAQPINSGNLSTGVNSYVLPSSYPPGLNRQSTDSHPTVLSGHPNELPVTHHHIAVSPHNTAIIIPTTPPAPSTASAGAAATRVTPITAVTRVQPITVATTIPPTTAAITPTITRAPSTAPTATLLLLILHGLFYCYLFGVILFGANFLLQIAVLCYQSYARPVIRDGRFRIVETSGNRAPCSFANNIFINPALYDPETFQQILIHEKIHVSGRHTLDILLAEMAVVLQWFNPFVWLYRREVENNLEFLTDQSVLQHREVERSAYQLSLLRVSAPHLPFSITNNYNQSLLKRRIVMMNTQRSSRHAIWKYFFLLPILTILVCALNKPAVFGQQPTATAGPSGHPNSPGNNRAADPDTTIQPAAHPADNAHPAADARPSAAGGLPQAMPAQAESAVSVQSESNASAVASPVVSVNTSQNVSVNVHPVVSLNLRIDTTIHDSDHTSNDIHISSNSSDADFKEGSWFVTTRDKDSKLEFELKSGDDDNYWRSSFSVERSEIDHFPGEGSVEFRIAREVGTMVFKGQFDGRQGFGHFTFVVDEAWFSALKQLGIEDIEEHNKGTFFTMNIKQDYVAMLQRSGYTPIRGREVVSLNAMHIDEDFLRYWKGSGVEGTDQIHNLISLKAMHIDKEYVEELKVAGYDHLAVHQLISLKAQRIDGRYVRSMGAGSSGSPIPPHELISYKAMNIDSNYLASLKKLGYDHLTRGEIMSLYSLHVTADYIKGFQDAGFTDIPPHTVVSLKSMGITAEYAKGFRDLGYKDLEPHRLISLKSMGITPEYILEFKKIGYDNIPVGLLTSLKATGVNAEYVSKMKEKGLDSKDLNKYMRLKREFN